MNNPPRIGYVPFNPTLKAPGDRRRFVAYARARNLPFELARFDQRYDVVVLSELADISIWCEYRQGKVVFDFIDSYLSVPRSNWRQLLRGPLWYALRRHRKLRDYLSNLKAMCRRADAVICTTDEQKEMIRQFCNNVHIILDIHSTVATEIKKGYAAGQPFRLVWEGLPTTIPQLATLAPVLRGLSKNRDFELHVVSNPGKSRNQNGIGLGRRTARHLRETSDLTIYREPQRALCNFGRSALACSANTLSSEFSRAIGRANDTIEEGRPVSVNYANQAGRASVAMSADRGRPEVVSPRAK